jgi:hypothetical protein
VTKEYRDLIRDLHAEIRELKRALQTLVDCDDANCDWENGGAEELGEAYGKAREVLAKYPLTYTVS